MQIANNARELFALRGFHSVRVEDIAAATGITARAVYRHYQNKQALLTDVVNVDQQRLMQAFVQLDETRSSSLNNTEANLRSVVSTSLTSRHLSLMWQREARHLGADDYVKVRANTRWIAGEVARNFLVDRADLDSELVDMRSWILVSLLTSPGHYELTVPVDAVIELLSSAIRNIVEMGVPAVDVPRPTVDGTRLLSSRREQLIRSAARAFRRRGFAGVALDDLTADVGVVGPALYRYFDSKADLLAAITSRFNEWDALESTRALAVAGSESEALDLLIRGYIQIALDATDALACMLTESLYLPEKVANRVHRMRSDSLGEWIDWLMKLRQELTEGTAQVLCNAARTIVDDLVRIPHLRSDGRLAGELHGAVMATFYARSSLTPPRESTAST